MTAIITDIITGQSYTVHCAADCRGSDVHAYEMYCRTGQTVQMGSVCVHIDPDTDREQQCEQLLRDYPTPAWLEAYMAQVDAEL